MLVLPSPNENRMTTDISVVFLKKQLGRLAEPNAGHAVIEATPREFMVIGGEQSNTEKCVSVSGSAADGEMSCEIFNTIDILSIAVNYPELFLVDDEYCKIK